MKTKIAILLLVICSIPVVLLSQSAGNQPAAISGKGIDSASCKPFDYGGITYHTIMIGSQCWMSDNLNIGKWVNTVGSQKIGDSGNIEKYCFGNDFVQCDHWGGLYQWGKLMKFSKEAGTRGICPQGWHIPASKDWKTLIRFLGGEEEAGGKMKSTLQWKVPNVGATNSSGFSAIPGGYFDGTVNKWHDLYVQGYYWSSEIVSETQAVGINLNFRSGEVNMYEEFQAAALSVRCVKN